MEGNNPIDYMAQRTGELGIVMYAICDKNVVPGGHSYPNLEDTSL